MGSPLGSAALTGAHLLAASPHVGSPLGCTTRGVTSWLQPSQWGHLLAAATTVVTSWLQPLTWGHLNWLRPSAWGHHLGQPSRGFLPSWLDNLPIVQAWTPRSGRMLSPSICTLVRTSGSLHCGLPVSQSPMWAWFRQTVLAPYTRQTALHLTVTDCFVHLVQADSPHMGSDCPECSLHVGSPALNAALTWQTCPECSPPGRLGVHLPGRQPCGVTFECSPARGVTSVRQPCTWGHLPG